MKELTTKALHLLDCAERYGDTMVTAEARMKTHRLGKPLAAPGAETEHARVQTVRYLAEANAAIMRAEHDLLSAARRFASSTRRRRRPA